MQLAASASSWTHAAWQAEDARHLRGALGFSLALHAIALFVWKFPPHDWAAAAGAPVLTVSLRGGVDAPAPPPPATGAVERRQPSPLLTQEHALLAVPARPATGAAGAASQAAPASAHSTPPAVPRSAGRPAPLPPTAGIDRPVPARAGGVTALLTIGEGGRVAQILWLQLPALTDPQLKRLEALVRARPYAGALAGQTLNEEIDVRALLALPPPRAEPAAASAEPVQ